ncbi:tetratricopeptide repeat protein [Sphingobacterium bovistauri]|uniref:Tetratricopeptide repeat-containing protein n=1 Tax=Sphingobacterium bovistauri TaxID=2781959 RepID=A0ABS7ZA26_9SPHI|nr:hypothetical protein [Sphingobacterium bovistauri]MCA5006432.1 hypothetical protein [Sphingobacterium bovistauri]
MEHLADKIQDYIEGHLEGQDLIEFENHLNQDIEFRNLVKLQKEVHGILNKRLTSGESDLRESLFLAENKMKYRKKGIFQRLQPLMAVASAACLLFAGYLFLFSPSDNLYELPSMQSEIVRGQESNEQYEEAVQLYNKQSYAESRAILNILIEKEPDVIQYQYYVGLSYLGEQKWLEASEKLTTIAEGQSIFKDEAKYYLAVSLDKQGKTSDAIALLKMIPSQGDLGKKAEKLLKKMN